MKHLVIHDNISIHALREEGDLGAQVRAVVSRAFLSTPSARRATFSWYCNHQWKKISIHALREEGDAQLDKIEDLEAHFYPRPPRGGRL